MTKPLPPVVARLPWLVALSGATALAYQALWLRRFGLVFGNTTDAVAMVLATFMGGLALGSLAAARRPARDPLRAYARVELGVAATAVVSLPLLEALPGAYASFAARAGFVEAIGRGVCAALIVLPTTTLLGATMPLVVECMSRGGHGLRASFGRLYLANTLGGALGAFGVTFVLVPLLGVRWSLGLAALCNLLIAGFVWRGSTGHPLPEAAPPTTLALPLRPWVAGVAAATGIFSFGIEVLWTRSYALVVGSSVYAFSLMLVAVLLGLAAGTAVYQRLRPRLADAPVALGWVLLALAAATLVGVLALGRLPIVSFALIRELPVSFFAHQLAAFVLCLLTMLPVTTLLGLSFPLLSHAADERRPQQSAGALYAWNTAGAVIGALGADLVLVPRLGLQPGYLVLAVLPLLAGLLALGIARGRRAPLLAASLAVVATLALAPVPWFRPWDPVLMTAGVYKYGLEWRDQEGAASDLSRRLREERRQLFYREGREAVVAVSERIGSGRRFLSVNGKTDAGSGAEDVVTQRFIAHVPLLLHPRPKLALVIGWGAGATAASAALYPLASLECVEIEPATFEAAPLFAELSGRVAADRRFRITFRDGRNHLLAARERFDVIVSEPSNPWITGVSNLFTRDFYRIAYRRLAPGGVFGQWFHYYNLEPRDVRVELRSFLDVFPHASLWLVPPLPGPDGGRLGADMLLVGSQEPHTLDFGRLQQAMAGSVGDELRATGVIRDGTDVIAAWALGTGDMQRYADDRVLFPRGTPRNTDDHPVLEFDAPRRNVMAPGEVARAALAQYRALAEAASELRPPLRGHAGLEAGGAAAAAFYLGLAERHVADGLAGRARQELARALVLDANSAPAHARLGELLLDAGRLPEAEQRLRDAVGLDPGDAKSFDLLGGLLIDRKDYAAAERVHREQVRHHPGAIPPRLRLGAVLARLGRWSEARDVLLEARRLDPEAPIDAALMEYLGKQAASQRP